MDSLKWGFPMSMHINLSPAMEQYIKSKVAEGSYGNATEVVRDAIRRMQAAERHIAAFQAAVAEGTAQLDRGEGIPYDAALMDALTEEALRTSNADVLVEPDVVA